jgi:hypothetical protein
VRWRKLGVVWRPDGSKWWAQSHATCPTPLRLDADTLRIFIQCRDGKGVGRVGYVDVDVDDPLSVKAVSPEPVFDIGLPGTFDDNGVLQTCVIHVGDELYMYYVGFELSLHIRYRLLSGLAISRDGGRSFRRVRTTPILERSPQELYFRGGPYVLRENGIFRMWYVAGSEWMDIDGKSMPVYELRYMTSGNGVDWPVCGQASLRLENADEHGFGRPYVVPTAAGYELFYSIRRRSFRQYRLGYARSVDGIGWSRHDDELGLDISDEGWDSEAIEYSAVVERSGTRLMFYNGNNFGETGFGVAVETAA